MLNEEEFSSDSNDEDYIPQGVSASEEEDSGEDEALIYQDEEMLKNQGELKRKNIKTDNRKRKQAKLIENKNESLEIPNKGKTDKLWDDFLKDTVTARPSSKTNSSDSSKAKVIEESNFGGESKNVEKERVDLTSKVVISSNTPLKNPVNSINNNTQLSNVGSYVSENPHLNVGNSDSEITHLNVGNSDSKNTHSNVGNSDNKTAHLNVGNSVISMPKNSIQISLNAIPPKSISSLNNQTSKKVGSGGLSSVLDKIIKKPKINILEKSKLDWQNFTKEEGIQEDLKKHNIGKQGYLERMSFLQRTDQKQFEIERDFRLANTKRF